MIRKHVQFSRTAGGYSLSRAGFITRLLSVCCAALQGITMEKVLVLPLFLLLSALTGVCVRSPKEMYVEAGEMVALNCSLNGEDNHCDAELIWTSPPSQEMDQTPNMSSAEQRHRDLLVHGRSLVILNATANHQGNYSCSLGNTSSQLWFRLRVCTKQSRGCEQRSRYPHPCHSQEACQLNCPDVNTPAVTLNITSNGVISWYKEGESMPKASYFSSVEEKDHGVYTCTRSYLYYGKIYNMTFTVVLDIQPKERLRLPPVIISPKSGVIHVNLGSPKVIDCKALMDSEFDEVFWFSTDSFVETNSSFPVFYNYTKEINGEEIKMTASLVFKKVSDEDLLKNYTCKLQTVAGPSTSVTISLFQKPRPSYVPLALGIVSIVLVTVLTVVIYVKFKITITLLLRDTLGCHGSTSDEKSYDAFLMCYKSDTDAGLNEDDRMCLESVLEERLGYSLCLYDRDVLPGKAVAEAVLDCIEESRTVLLVPSSPDTGPGSSLLSAIHAALVERHTRLVFIKTEKTEVLKSGSFPEALQILSEAGACVTWKGMRSMPPSSPFWKQLRYHLPAPQHASKTRLLPQTSQDVPSNV
ncbi:interleukin-18 receptor 1-like [Gymnodraco acuticeps]|uniref:Interleukin-18 receptor 1-like n=1 Tax=Gymnodraco acuticeps TaxID=8218 RepID=A0A6P8WWR6_GYMAC|nr:interleukin-18 receptor 1-like [Gymnodraco acuticeps]